MKVDVIVVGLGIAGCTLVLELMKRNKTFIVIDKNVDNSATKVSSGLINPITGRSFVKSWMIETLLPKAIESYLQLSKLLNIDIVNDKTILRGLHAPSDENQWFSRMGDDEYINHMRSYDSIIQYDGVFKNEFKLGEITQSRNIDSSLLMSSIRKYLDAKGQLISESIEYEQIEIDHDIIRYNGINAQHIIFAEGWGVRHNPYFNHLAFRPAKGEVLICKIPNFPNKHVIKYHKFFVPLGEDLFWIGSTYQWEFDDELPSREKKEELTSFLERHLATDFEIVDHLAAVRPTTYDRKPFVGNHPKYSNIHIFNGLGTKGISLAPYWAEYLVKHIFESTHRSEEIPLIVSRH